MVRDIDRNGRNLIQCTIPSSFLKELRRITELMPRQPFSVLIFETRTSRMRNRSASHQPRTLDHYEKAGISFYTQFINLVTLFTDKNRHFFMILQILTDITLLLRKKYTVVLDAGRIKQNYCMFTFYFCQLSSRICRPSKK